MGGKMKLIRINSCGECPYFGDGFCTRLRRFVSIDIVNPDCPLSSGECEWTQRMSEYERIACEKTRYLTGCKAVVWRYHHEVINDEPHCPCCGGRIKIKEAGDA